MVNLTTSYRARRHVPAAGCAPAARAPPKQGSALGDAAGPAQGGIAARVGAVLVAALGVGLRFGPTLLRVRNVRRFLVRLELLLRRRRRVARPIHRASMQRVAAGGMRRCARLSDGVNGRGSAALPGPVVRTAPVSTRECAGFGSRDGNVRHSRPWSARPRKAPSHARETPGRGRPLPAAARSSDSGDRRCPFVVPRTSLAAPCRGPAVPRDVRGNRCASAPGFRSSADRRGVEPMVVGKQRIVVV